jgi:hypothetical protein
MNTLEQIVNALKELKEENTRTIVDLDCPCNPNKETEMPLKASQLLEKLENQPLPDATKLAMEMCGVATPKQDEKCYCNSKEPMGITHSNYCQSMNYSKHDKPVVTTEAIIAGFAHDYRRTVMSEEELSDMLTIFLKQIRINEKNF